MKSHSVFQFKITLQEIEPAIWRRIQICEDCSFWDLHVAIQDVMGWKDYHLHQFELFNPETNEKQLIGIPTDEDFEVDNMLPGWNNKVKDYIVKNNEMLYLYDYGDSWYHEIEFEELHEKKDKIKYPICFEGKRACPPEDVGSIPGYYDFLEIIHNPKHEEYKSMLKWVGGKYDSESFDPKKVKFDNPSIRWKRAFDRD